MKTSGPRGWRSMLAALAFAATLLSSALAGDPIAVGVSAQFSAQPSSALLQIALERGLLREEGLDPIVTRYASGKLTLLDGLFAGKEDGVSSAGTPVVVQSFNRNDFAIIAASFNADDINGLVARRDRGIAAPADLAGKTIATQRASAVHYFLYLFPLKRRIPEDSVRFVFLQPDEPVPTLAAGEVDTFSMRAPYIGQARDLLGDDAVVFNEPGLFPQFEVTLVSREYLKAHPEAIAALLRALQRAEQLAADDPQQAASRLAHAIGSDPTEVADLPRGSRLAVSLDQSMLLAMEHQARRTIDAGLTDQQRMPNLLERIDFGPLGALDPRALTILH